MVMKRICWLILALLTSVAMSGQTQQGVVKTRGRMVNGQLKPGVPLQGATVQVKDRSAVVSRTDGKFEFPIRAKTYLLQSVKKKNYQLVDQEVCRDHKYSAEPLYLVMETPEQQRSDQLAAERKIRRNLQQQLQRREDEIDALNVSLEEKEKLLQKLYQQQTDNERLISDMAKRFATLDYDQLDDFYRQVNDLIENGELLRADSLLRSRGDVNVQVQAQLRKGQAIQEQETDLQKAKTVYAADNEELARRCYAYYESFQQQHQTDSAAHYLELRAALDTTNVQWQNDVGLYINEYIADYRKALSYYQRVLRQSLLQYGEESEWVTAGYNNIGVVYFNQGDYAKASEYHSKALAISEKVFGLEHPVVATSYNNIGLVYDSQGDYAKALEYYSKSLAIWENVFGLEHPHVARCYNNIGWVYDSQGDYAKALEYYSKSLTIGEKVFGLEHPDVAISYANIGGVYSNQGDYVKALEYYLKALSIQEKVYGLEHPDVAQVYNHIGSVYDHQGDYAKALEYYSKALSIQEKVFGLEHPEVATSYDNIGFVYYHQGDYVKTLEYYFKALAIREKVFGLEHPDAAKSYSVIGFVYHRQGDNSKAFEYYSKALAIFEKVFGLEHRYTKRVKDLIILDNPDEMKEYVFTATVAEGDTPARQQQMSGEYVVLEFADWTIESTTSLFNKNNELRGKPKTIVVMQDGVVSQHHFENAIGVQFALKQTGKQEKERIIEEYRQWKKQ